MWTCALELLMARHSALTPNTTSITATAVSAAATKVCGMLNRSASTIVPQINNDAVWPTPQSAPATDERTTLLFLLTIVETATRWSGSSAWRMPSAKPNPNTAKLVFMIRLNFYTSVQRALSTTYQPQSCERS